MFSCCMEWCGDTGSGHVTLKEMPTVQLDTHNMGKMMTVALFVATCSILVTSIGEKVKKRSTE